MPSHSTPNSLNNPITKKTRSHSALNPGRCPRRAGKAKRTYSIGVQATPSDIDTELIRLCDGHSVLKYYREYKIKRKTDKYPNLIITAKCGERDDGPIDQHYGQDYVRSPKHPNVELREDDVMFADRLYLIYTLIALQGSIVQCRKRNNIKPHEIDENFLLQRCELLCLLKAPDMCTCRQNPSELSKKPGHCPNSTNSILEKICLDDCKEGNDNECPGTKICCKQDCGYSCQDATGLDNDPDLPPIPVNVTVSDRRCNAKMCQISWEMDQSETQILPIFFIIETRSHVGNVFSPRKLGPWQFVNFQKMAEAFDHARMIKTTVVSIKLKLGLWYELRVAAINQYGFRGYSNISQEFRLTDHNHVAEPKAPRSPRNLEVYTIGYWPNDTVLAKATWTAPKSDLPIDRYKISWALYLNDNFSLYLNFDYVKEPITFYELTNLRRDSSYYVQVQAISTNGRKRLKSMKESQLLNTTTDNLLTPTAEEHVTANELTAPLIEHENQIRYQYLPNRKYGMLLRVFSERSFNGSFVELCSASDDCETKEYGAFRPRKDQIIFSKLKFNTHYTLRVFYRNSIRRREITKTFITPHCEKFKKAHPNLSINC